MASGLPQLAKRLLDDDTFVVVSTTNPDGSPQSSVVWAKRDGDDVLFSTIRGRRKTRNMERNPRVSVVGFDPANPYQYFEVRGPVTLTEEGGRELIDELSRKYTGKSYDMDGPDAVRVVARVTPQRVVSR
jgi:PPOX class probable F420-dependent enzyme